MDFTKQALFYTFKAKVTIQTLHSPLLEQWVSSQSAVNLKNKQQIYLALAN
jgi:hypothetical protein